MPPKPDGVPIPDAVDIVVAGITLYPYVAIDFNRHS